MVEPPDQPLLDEQLFQTLLDELALADCGDAMALTGFSPAIGTGTGGLLSPQAMPSDPVRAVIMGVIDHAIPFAHRAFSTASGHSRVAAIWMQGAAPDRPASAGGDLPFGRELRGVGLDLLRRRPDGGLLSEEQTYRQTGALGLRRDGREGRRLGPGLAARISHGAAVAGLAAGLSPDDPDSRNLPIIAVSLPDHLVADTSGAFAPYFVQAAIIFIVNRARRLAARLQAAGRVGPVPVVINLSYGVTAGPRDGSLGLVQLQDLIALNTRDHLHPVHFVLPSGNHRLERLHGQIAKGQSVQWQIPPDDPTPNVVEIWGPRQAQPGDQPGIELSLTLPGGQVAATDFCDQRDGISKLMAGGVEIARAYRQFRQIRRRQSGERYWRQCLTLIAAPTLPVDSRALHGAPSGFWQLTLTDGPATVMDIDVQRDDRLSTFPGTRRQSRLYDQAYQGQGPSGHPLDDDPADPRSVLRRRGTANAYGSGDTQLRVGGAIGGNGVTVATAGASGSEVARYSGLLLSGSPGDLLAQSDRSRLVSGVMAHGCLSGSRADMSGTSVAAPQVARWLALALLEGADLPDRASVIAHAADGRQPPSP
ncbi:hypothetical protein FNJ84_18195 [Paracoccus sp. M683]|uniref:hypothetical protein n=1 Tax=Paracoccus sp. M683 TaxID=2594268 RepID=UPI00117C9AF9|nr:hypothetical protein [Paracoccus sp. M683]TRW94799.1 hypothetical protein FNJ84_18195 [Paracoccus sp. M683]